MTHPPKISAQVAMALNGQLDTTRLIASEAIEWLDAFTEKMGRPSEAELALFAQRKEKSQYGPGME